MTKTQVRIEAQRQPEEYLNIDCTMEHLMKYLEAMKIMQPMMDAASQIAGDQAAAFSPETMMQMVKAMTLRQMLDYGNVPDEVKNQMDAQFHQIKNDR